MVTLSEVLEFVELTTPSAKALREADSWFDQDAPDLPIREYEYEREILIRETVSEIKEMCKDPVNARCLREWLGNLKRARKNK